MRCFGITKQWGQFILPRQLNNLSYSTSMFNCPWVFYTHNQRHVGLTCSIVLMKVTRCSPSFPTRPEDKVHNPDTLIIFIKETAKNKVQTLTYFVSSSKRRDVQSNFTTRSEKKKKSHWTKTEDKIGQNKIWTTDPTLCLIKTSQLLSSLGPLGLKDVFPMMDALTALDRVHWSPAVGSCGRRNLSSIWWKHKA